MNYWFRECFLTRLPAFHRCSHKKMSKYSRPVMGLLELRHTRLENLCFLLCTRRYVYIFSVLPPGDRGFLKKKPCDVLWCSTTYNFLQHHSGPGKKELSHQFRFYVYFPQISFEINTYSRSSFNKSKQSKRHETMIL